MGEGRRGPGGSKPGGPPRPWSEATRRAVFWKRVEKTETCWLWVGAMSTTGYGRITWDNRSTGAHRISYEMLVGPIPDDLELDHLCRVKRCVNPAHLEAVTHQENVARAAAVHVPREHCRNGHLRTAGNTRRDKAGWIECLTCRRQRDALRKRQERARARAERAA